MAGSHYGGLVIRRSSTGSKLKIWYRLLSSTPSPQPPPPKRGHLSSLFSSFLSSFRGFRLGRSLIGAGTDHASSDVNDVTGRRFKFNRMWLFGCSMRGGSRNTFMILTV